MGARRPRWRRGANDDETRTKRASEDEKESRRGLRAGVGTVDGEGVGWIVGVADGSGDPEGTGVGMVVGTPEGTGVGGSVGTAVGVDLHGRDDRSPFWFERSIRATAASP